MHTISFNYTYTCLCLSCRHLALGLKYDFYGLAPFFYYNTSLVFHLESSNENLKWFWSQATGMRVREMKNKCLKTLIVIVTVTGPTGVTGPRVIKFGYKEFTVKGQRWHAGCRNCNKRIQDKVNVTKPHKCFHKASVNKWLSVNHESIVNSHYWN